jgi:hypothetical protein
MRKASWPSLSPNCAFKLWFLFGFKERGYLHSCYNSILIQWSPLILRLGGGSTDQVGSRRHGGGRGRARRQQAAPGTIDGLAALFTKSAPAKASGPGCAARGWRENAGQLGRGLGFGPRPTTRIENLFEFSNLFLIRKSFWIQIKFDLERFLYAK